jgi:hypothetical protein
VRLRFGLARDEAWLLVCLRIMRFSRCIAFLACAFVIVICSCEKHRLGEFPEVQKEVVDPAKAANEPASAPGQSKSPSRDSASPTPAEFFPEKKSP